MDLNFIEIKLEHKFWGYGNKYHKKIIYQRMIDYREN